jgi:tRNA-guanine family transglycosylase
MVFEMSRQLKTSKGIIELPVYMPVTTYGRFPIDDLIRPYLPRFTQCIMVSHYYAQAMKSPPDIPLFIDSGGFASIFEGSQVIEDGDFAVICTSDDEIIDPQSVLKFQIEHAQIGATLDFLITPSQDATEASRRYELTIRNAIWAVEQDRPADFNLFASVQAWDRGSAIEAMERLSPYRFDGFALGGMVPRVSDPESIFAIVDAIREVEQERPLHVFGVGKLGVVKELFCRGVDSIDTSTYVQNAVSKKLVSAYGDYIDADLGERLCECAICLQFETQYLSMSGELNCMAIALHNLQKANDLTRMVRSSSDLEQIIATKFSPRKRDD